MSDDTGFGDSTESDHARALPGPAGKDAAAGKDAKPAEASPVEGFGDSTESDRARPLPGTQAAPAADFGDATDAPTEESDDVVVGGGAASAGRARGIPSLVEGEPEDPTLLEDGAAFPFAKLRPTGDAAQAKEPPTKPRVEKPPKVSPGVARRVARDAAKPPRDATPTPHTVPLPGREELRRELEKASELTSEEIGLPDMGGGIPELASAAEGSDATMLEDRGALAELAASLGKKVQRIGRYRVLKHLEAGGFANVYLARLVGVAGFGRFVAIKRIHDHLAGQHEFLEMFLDEARVASAIDHPHVCAPIDFGRTHDGTYFLAMDYLLGEPLTAVRKALGQKKGREVSAEDIAFSLRIIADAAHGLHAAHEATDVRGRPLEVVHRDVAPGNLFILYSGHVKVVDFGIAQAARKLHTTKAGMFKGHLAFAAPEQVQADPIDRRADVWSLGVILWELLARRRLFRSGHELALINMILVDPIPELRQLAPWVPERIAEVVHSCLQRDPDQRPDSALDLALALEACLLEMQVPMGTHEVGSYVCALLPDRAHRKHRELWALAGDLGSTSGVRDLDDDDLEEVATTSVIADGAEPAESGEWAAETSPEVEPPPHARPQALLETMPMRAQRAEEPERRSPWPIYLGLVMAIVLAFALGRWMQPEPRDVRPVLTPPPAPAASMNDESSAETEGADEGSSDPDAEEAVAIEVEEAAAEPAMPAMRTRPRGSGSVALTTTGGWAEVWYGRRKLGVTPGEFDLPAGRRRLRLVRPGRGSKNVIVRIRRGQTTRRRVEL